ncbi:arylsulfatase [Planctomycetales bacterium ZRK34]|nr:arylsulfatase [Planctomycetales bacterium ZRK34]
MRSIITPLTCIILIAFAASAPADAPPNILYILCDDLGYGDVQGLNLTHGKIPTPHIDRLIVEGMTFSDAHSGSSVCTPTRYGILTGRYAWRTRLQRGVLGGADEDPLIAADRLTVPALLRKHGYTTAIIGKWHLGFNYASDVHVPKKPPQRSAGVPVGSRIVNGPTTRGFDHFYGFEHARSMSTVIEDGRVTAEIKPIDMLPAIADRAVDYITQRGRADDRKPFFLYLALNSPHTPLVPAAEWQGRSPLGPYGDFVMQTDHVVGQVLTALDQANLTDNTLVIFTSDNGCAPYIGVDKLQKQGHYPSADRRGYKSDIWDGGHRIPFIVRWPGHVDSGSVSDQLICLTDLMATCADLLDVDLPASAGEDSISILPVLEGTATQPVRQTVVHHSINGEFALRRGPWKLVFCPGSGGWTAPRDAAARKQGLPSRQLYQMHDDIAESVNLQSSQTARVKQMTELMERDIAAGRSTPGPAQSNDVKVQFATP